MNIRDGLALSASLALLAACGGGGGSGSAPATGTAPTPTPAPAPSPSPTPTPTTTAFAEEFNAASLDRSVWTPVGPDFWVNNEVQAYIDAPETIELRQGVAGADGGVLVLKPIWTPGADPRSDRNADFSSGRIESRGAYDFTYGRA
ncbi:MAG: hypothetical protein HRT64_05480, partial [Erythrobacter sp.]|nr:hypothetical protein [Erythrobacter sp.]